MASDVLPAGSPATVAERADFEAAGLLDGLEGEAREARVRLLRRLVEADFTLDELRRAHAEGLLPFLLAEREVTGPQTMTQPELAERAGVGLDVLQRLRRAQGLPSPEPGQRAFGEGDLELARTVRGLLDAGVPLDRLLEVSRLLGRGLQPVAEVMRGMALEQAFDPELPEDVLADRFQQRAAALLPFIAPSLIGAMRVQLAEMVAIEAAAVLERRGGMAGGQRVAVAFADLTGFTRLGERLEPGALGAVAERLAGLIGACAQPGVRVVKELGDGAMLVAPRPAQLVETGLALVEAAEADDELPSVRVGIAAGEALPRAGDWFGRPVNIASRICGAARPASVLATRDVRDEVAEVDWSSAGPKRLKGLDEPVRLYRARRRAPDERAA